MTSFHKAHSTEVAGLHDNPSGDDRYYNNLFVAPWNMTGYDTTKPPAIMSGNVFLKGAKPSKVEAGPLVKPDLDPALKPSAGADTCSLEITVDAAWSTERTRKLVTTYLLVKALVPHLPFENPDGSPLPIDTGYFGKPRNPANPSPGTFENPGKGKLMIKVR